MAPVNGQIGEDASSKRITKADLAVKNPHPSYVQVAKPYIFEQMIEDCMTAIGTTTNREDLCRLQGVKYIDEVRKKLGLPVRTFNTAAIYYHKFRLVHPDTEYNWMDASAAALFTACKVEDTLKKSKDILCTAYNRSLPVSEHLSPDDSAFEGPSRNIIGLERLMLESSTFDFRARHPQKLLIKLLKRLNIERSSPLARTAYTMSIDLYRTFAPLKQTSATMAFACLELSARVLDDASTNSLLSDLTDESQYTKWRTSRAEIMETMRDALSLFTDHRSHSTLGPTYTIDTFLNISIALKQEADAAKLPRYTYYQTRKPPAATTTNGRATNGSSRGGRHNNNRNTQPTRNQQQPPTPQNRMTPAAVIDTSALLNPSSTTQPTVPVSNPQQTIRYLLSPLAAASETAKTTAYFTVDESEYEVEEEVSAAEWAKMQAAAAAQAQAPTGPRGHGHHGHGPSRGRGGYGRGFGRGGHPGRR